jgi:excisionase family DNA binding protein
MVTHRLVDDAEQELELLSTSEVARALGISSARVHQLATRGELPAFRAGWGYVYRGRDVRDLVARRRELAREDWRITPPPQGDE